MIPHSHFYRRALKAEQEVVRNGEVYAMDAVHRYFIDELAGKIPKRPKPTFVVLKARRQSQNT